MVDPKISPVEFHMLRQETEAQGELLSAERLQRKAEVDQLRLEIEALKKVLGQVMPGFTQRYSDTYSELLHEFNPDLDRKVS